MSETMYPKPQWRRRGRPFPKGRSGNPAGRLPGSRNKATLAAELYLDGEAEEVCRSAVEQARAGNTLAMKLVLDRTIAPRRERPTPFALPPIERPADLAPAMAAILAAAARGILTTAQAAELATVVTAALRAVETGEFDRRLSAVEDGRAPE
jgi:hypothetical protein